MAIELTRFDTEMTQYGADNKQRGDGEKANSDAGHDSIDTHVDSHYRSSKGHFSNASVDSVMTIAPTPPPPRHVFPDGGYKAYMTVLGAAFALFSGFGQMNAFGTFQTYYEEHHLSHLSPATISWIGSLQLWVFFFSVRLINQVDQTVKLSSTSRLQGGPIGIAFDKYGPRVLLLAGTFCYILSIMLTSISTQYYQLILAQGVLFGLGVGLLYVLADGD